MFQRLTINQANEILNKAQDMKKRYPRTRLGQNVMNSLPTDIGTSIIGTDLDIFNSDVYNDCVKMLFDERITIL